MLPETNALARNVDENKCLCFLIEDAELLKKYNKIRNKVSNSIKKDFDSQPVANGKYLQTKIKSY